jgi:hypothetical protein
VVVFWFEPQALFIDDVVDEAFPTVEPSEAEPPTTRRPKPRNLPRPR